MKLEEILLNPRETLLLVVDVQKDFLEAQRGFAFFDADADISLMRAMVSEHLIPLIGRSLAGRAHVAYVKSEYVEGQFPHPYGKLCLRSPGTDFYLIDGVNGFEREVKLFTKSNHDPFKNPALRGYIKEEEILNLIVAGVTVTNCIDVAVESAVQIPDLRVIVPEDCVSYRKERETDAKSILEGYASPQNKKVIVVNSRKIQYKNS